MMGGLIDMEPKGCESNIHDGVGYFFMEKY